MAELARGYVMAMGLLDRLLGRTPRRNSYGQSYPPSGTPSYGTPSSTNPQGYPPEPGAPAYGTPPSSQRQQPSTSSDDEAVRRYRYLLRTAPPEAIEQAHAEAFAQLTPEQRRQVLDQLANEVPQHERIRDDDPRALARFATRAELRQPGLLERILAPRGYGGGYGRGYGYGGGGMGMGMGGMGMGGMGGGMGMGGMIGGSLLASVAGGFIGTAIAEEMFDHNDYQNFVDNDASSVAGDGSDLNFDNDQVDATGVDDRTGGDYGSGDGGGQEFGDFGGDGGGSDFGGFDGGDLGGGDFGGGGDW